MAEWTAADPATADGPARVGVVSLARGRHDHLDLQHRSLAAGGRLPDDYVVVAMGDPEIEPTTVGGLRRDVVRCDVAGDRLPLAAARNRGVTHLLERGVEVVVALDVDCAVAPGTVEAFASAVADEPSTIWSGPVTYLSAPTPDGYHLATLADLDSPHPARPAPAPGERLAESDPNLFWSLCFALSPRAWSLAGGFHEGYDGYGGEDTDFARSAQAAGLRFGWVGSARAYHQHHPVSDPPVEHLDDVLRNGRTFHRRWGEWPMLGWIEAFERAGLVRRRGDDWVRTDRRGSR